MKINEKQFFYGQIHFILHQHKKKKKSNFFHFLFDLFKFESIFFLKLGKKIKKQSKKKLF